MPEIVQILYECKKCGEMDAASVRIGAGTVSTRLCPICETEWGQFVRTQDVWLAMLEAARAERFAVDALEASRAIADGLRYRREICDVALEWLKISRRR